MLAFVAALVIASAAAQDSRPALPDYGPLTNMLLTQPLAETRAELERRLAGSSTDENERLALGVTRFFDAIERLAQSLHRHGFKPRQSLDILESLGVYPNLRRWLPVNPQPEEISYDDLRRIIQRFHDDLAEVDQVLSGIRDPAVKFTLPIGRVRLDFDRDGRLGEDEYLWRLFVRVVNIRNFSEDAARALVITLDRADVEWLRGYTHLLRALCQCVLAYDFHDLFERTAHLMFLKPVSPYGFLIRPTGYDSDEFVDMIAVIHLLNFKLHEPVRMRAAHAHLLCVIAHSREMWRLVREETDDDHEWLPSQRQCGVLPGIQFTDSMIDGWLDMLTESERMLNGTRLIPFWRDDQRGVNLQKFFLEPRDLDLVMWIQGTAAAPFLAEGEKTTPEVWQRFSELFKGRLFAYAVWVN